MYFLQFRFSSSCYVGLSVVTATVPFGFSGQRSRYVRVTVTLGWSKKVCNSEAILPKEDV